jgi:uncharacterized membrane protein YeaQ/YmgE (transglycosylase-associated protein family)
MGILSWIVVGLIAGFLAGLIIKGSGFGLIWDIVIGVLGGLLGGWIATSLFHWGDLNGINLYSILIALGGAILLLAIAHVIRRH